MRRTIIMPGVNIANPDLDVIPIDAASLAIAALPALRWWLSPAPEFDLAGTRVDRIANLRFAPVNVPTRGGGINAQPAFNFTNDIYWKYLRNEDDAASSLPDPATAAYTVVTVLKPNVDVAALMCVLASSVVTREGIANQRQILINTQFGSVGVAHNRTGFAEQIVGSPAGSVDMTKTILLMTTYSGGTLRMFVNDVLVVTVAIPYINPRGALVGAAGDDVRQYRGLMGEVLEFNADYSTSALAGARTRLVAYLKGKYGIA